MFSEGILSYLIVAAGDRLLLPYSVSVPFRGQLSFSVPLQGSNHSPEPTESPRL
jgi:hypothetical protein